jgi:hypothetical protein
MDTKGKITAELIGVLVEKDRQIRNAILGYTLKSPEEKILSARDAFLGFDDLAQPGPNIRTSVPVSDSPGVNIDARIEFPMEQVTTDEDNDDDRYNTHESKWNNKLVISARANDGVLEHTQPSFTQLGIVEFNGSEPAILHTASGDVKFGEPGSEEIMEIIDSAVIGIFEKNEVVRKKMGHNALARRWEQILDEGHIEKPGVFSSLKNLFGKRPE